VVIGMPDLDDFKPVNDTWVRIPRHRGQRSALMKE
jgi:GGDEF domain-containing protein